MTMLPVAVCEDNDMAVAVAVIAWLSKEEAEDEKGLAVARGTMTSENVVKDAYIYQSAE
jgi:hypothetical protein